MSARPVQAGFLYFAMVFGAGFALGPVRIFFVVPRVGERLAELLETPFMVVAIVLAARWIVRRLGVSKARTARLAMGLVAAGLLLVAEFALVAPLRGISLGEYFAKRDPVSGTVYYLTVCLFAAMPLLVRREG